MEQTLFYLEDMSIKSKQILTDYSVSKEKFELVYNDAFEMYETKFTSFDKLDSYYQSADYISHTDGTRNWFEKVYQLVKNYTIKSKWNLIKKQTNKQYLKVLDIGCGTGDFLKYGIDTFSVQGVGVEPNTTARNLTQNKNVTVKKSIKEINNDLFDVITLWHVLEHVTDLNEYFTFFKNHLKEDGILVIAVPNYKSYDAKYYKQYWAAWDVPRHLWHFSKKSLKKIGIQHQFKLMHIKPMYFDSFYVSLLSEKYKSNSKNVLKAFFIGFVSNLYGFFKNEYSSHIYILKK